MAFRLSSTEVSIPISRLLRLNSARSCYILPSSNLVCSRQFHSSNQSSARETSKYIRSLRNVQKHYARIMRREKPEIVDPILGRSNVPFMERVKATLSEPVNQVFGFTKQETDRLLYGAEQAALLRADDWSRTQILKNEKHKQEIVSRILSAQNSSQAEMQKKAVALAVEEFGRFEGDTGSSEVQAAVSTIKIHYLTNHAKEHKKDNASIRRLQIMVQGRQTILKYLKRSNPERYYWAIEKLGLNDTAATQEFTISRRYLDQFQFFGPNTLRVKDNKKERAAKTRLARMEQKAKKFM